VISEAAVRQAVGPAEALASAERAFRALADGLVVQPAPMGLVLESSGGEVHVKGAYLEGSPIFAVKVATGFYRNAERGLPSGSGLFLVFEAQTGFPVGVLCENGYLTDLRTGAAGALAARYLAPEAIGVVAILGTGVQARYQARCLALVRRWRATRVWGRSADRAARYCSEMEQDLGFPFHAVATAADAVRGADVVITVTPSRLPIVQADWLAPHATVIAVGSDAPDKQELAVECLVRAHKVVADCTSQCTELGEIHHAVEAGLLAPERVYAELGEIVAGRKPGREADELIVCDLTGVGAQDAAIAEAAWSRLAGTGEAG
jgi:ornithine cyclodeaminase